MSASEKSKQGKPNKTKQKENDNPYVLRLYVAGQTQKSVKAVENLQRICVENLSGKYRIEVIDLLVNPKLAEDEQILAVPTLVKQLPLPIKRLIGDFSDTEQVLVGLDLRPEG